MTSLQVSGQQYYIHLPPDLPQPCHQTESQAGGLGQDAFGEEAPFCSLTVVSTVECQRESWVVSEFTEGAREADLRGVLPMSLTKVFSTSA